MYSCGKLKEDKTVLEVSLPSSRPNGTDRTFQVTLTRVSSVNTETIKKFLDGKLSYTPYDVISALEVILRHPLVQSNIVVGRSLYNGENSQRISGGLEVWKGYFMSIRPGAGRLLLNVDTTVTAFYAPGKCIELVSQFLRVRPGDMIKSVNEQETRQLEQLFRNLKVLPTHRPGSTRRYRVIGLTRDPARECKFESEEGPTNVFAYFQKKYNIVLKEPDLPCFVVGSKERSVFLPIECCDIPAGQRFLRKLGEEQTSDMIKIANQHPDQRFDAIIRSSKLVDANKEYLDKFQIQFGNQLVQINARILKAPTVFYHRDSQEPDCTPVFGAWGLTDKKVAVSAPIESWAIVSFENVHRDQLGTFLHMFGTTCISLGISCTTQRVPHVHAQDDIEESLKQACECAKRQFGRPAQLILVILPSTDSCLYGEVKRCSDTVLGLPTQCMQAEHIVCPDKRYCANLALKINVKCGGVNSNLGKQMHFISEEPTMVLGADVTHPGIGDKEKPSIAAVVASMDIQLSRYATAIRVQDSRQELIVEIKQMFKEHVEAFQITNKTRPQRILFYRDGVSESQFQQVLEFELAQIKAGAKEIDPVYAPTITVILVQKRHHTRFLPVDQGVADPSGNVPAGTVVDTEICHPTQFDFYLCSHASVNGISRPTHYYVVYDDHNFTSDAIQVLSYNMCFTFARCTRSVSIVPPVYYAHLAAYRARFYFPPIGPQDPKTFFQVNQGLQRTMYFI